MFFLGSCSLPTLHPYALSFGISGFGTILAEVEGVLAVCVRV